MDDVMRIGADTLEEMKTWVDASYAVHPDMKSHTGGCLSFGIGVLLAMSTKQKLNTKSSTEAEEVGASDYLPCNVWVRMSMEVQGYIRENIYYQDNMSAMKLEKNGRMSCGRNSRHIDIRYFSTRLLSHPLSSCSYSFYLGIQGLHCDLCHCRRNIQ